MHEFVGYGFHRKLRKPHALGWGGVAKRSARSLLKIKGARRNAQAMPRCIAAFGTAPLGIT